MAATADLVPADVVRVAVAVDVDGLRDERRMRCGVGDIEEERLIGTTRLTLADHPDRLVGEIVGEEVAVGILIDLDDVVVLHQPVRMVQVRERLEHSIETIEAALHRPPVLRACGGHRRVAAQVPFADHHRGIAVAAQHLGGSRHIAADLGAVTGEAGVVLRDVAHPCGVAVEAREQAGTGGRAHRVHVEVAEPHTLGCEPVEVGRADLAAEAADVGEPDVVDQHEDDVRCIGGRDRLIGPVGFGARHRAPHDATEVGRLRNDVIGHRAGFRKSSANAVSSRRRASCTRVPRPSRSRRLAVCTAHVDC